MCNIMSASALFLVTVTVVPASLLQVRIMGQLVQVQIKMPASALNPNSHVCVLRGEASSLYDTEITSAKYSHCHMTNSVPALDLLILSAFSISATLDTPSFFITLRYLSFSNYGLILYILPYMLLYLLSLWTGQYRAD
jgi:hypothetical protein